MSVVYQRTLDLPVTSQEAYDWHARPGAIFRLMPPWEHATVIQEAPQLVEGAEAVFQIHAQGLSVTWRAQHYDVEPGRQFCDRQLQGPFAYWRHQHRFDDLPEGTCQLTDRVEFGLPGGAVGERLGRSYVTRKIDRMFEFRHATTLADLRLHQKFREHGIMKICVTGSTGLIGSALVPLLTTGGHEVIRFRRPTSRGAAASNGTVSTADWDFQQETIDMPALEACDAVVHLAGESIAEGRWDDAKKQRIRDSRVRSTEFLAKKLAQLDRKPSVFVCASAIGFYGDGGDRELDEASPPGEGFLAEVCQQWEDATSAARDAGIRVVNLRFGVILSSRGGALAKMLTPFKLGAGGVVGSGKQYWSWIALEDAARAIVHAIMTPELQGPVNVVAPHPVTNAQFTRALGKVLHRPTIFPMPAFAARLALGEMADHLILASTRVLPHKLQQTHFEFRLPGIEAALESV